MAASAPAHNLSPNIMEELRTCALRVRNPAAALLLWEQVLTREERQRLGGELEPLYRRHGTDGIWQELRGVSAARAVIDVARELNLLEERKHRWLLREVGETADDPEEAIQLAVGSGALVLVERPRAAYWAGSPIDIDWDRYAASWVFLWELCRLAKAGQAIDNTALGELTAGGAVAKQKSRLALRGLPRDLLGLIRPVGTGTQKVHLPPNRIRLFEVVVSETLRELTP